jgi:nucleoside-diphosphate-sugar epimerase
VPRAFVTGGSGFIGGELIRRLRSEGWEVSALARSEAAVARVSEAGAEPAPGDLDDVAAMRAAAEGCEHAFHVAAKADDWGDAADFERVNVQGTRNAIEACRQAGVRRLVHVGTEAALMAGQPLVDVDEDTPLRPDSPALYPATKARAELAVRAADGEGIETVVIRPRFVWGRGDTTLIPVLAELVRSGRFRWIGGGTHLTDTTHVDNTVEGLWLGATRAPAGGVYFVTDGEPVVFKHFVTQMLATQDVRPGDKSVPLGLAQTLATGSEGLWRTLRLPGRPPVTRFAVWASGLQCTIDVSRARDQLGYRPLRTHAEGLAEMAGPAA